MARSFSQIMSASLGKNYDVDRTGFEKDRLYHQTRKGTTLGLSIKKANLEEKIKFDTFAEDLNKTSKTVNVVANKWQSKETMDSTKDSIRNMQERLDAYKEYRELFGEEIELPQIDVSFSPVLENWDSITQTYGKFKNADAFDKENAKLQELGNMTSSDVQKQMGNTKKTKSDYDSVKSYNNQVADAQAKVANARGAYDAINATNALNTAIKQRDDYAKSLGYKDYADLETKYNNSGIAYTTVDGQNITWESLYNTKQQKEQHNAIYKEYSSKNDFKEYSEKGANIKNPTWEEAEGGVNLFGWRPGAEEVQNKVSYALDNKDTILGKEMFSPGGKPVGDLNLTTISDEEKQIYDYLLAREHEGLEKEGTAQNYLDSIYDVLKDRYEGKWLGALSEYSDEHPVGGSVLSVGQNLFAGAEYLKDSANYLKTGELDTNFLAQASSTIRGTVSQGIDSGVGKFVYNTGMSMADSAVAMATLGSYGGISLGLSAAAQGTNDALARGLDDKSAFFGGVASGVFEGLFETVSIGKFKKLADAPVDGVKSVIKNVGKSMLVNASEETLTELANITYDNLVNADFSEFKTQVRAYENSGMSKQDAVRKASVDQGMRVAEAAASGALMGFGFGGVAGGKAYINNQQIGATIQEGGNAQEMFDISSIPEVGTAYEAYTNYANKGINADNIKNAQLGSLFTSAMQDTQNTLDSKKSTPEQKAIAEETQGRLEKVLTPSAKTVMETKGVKELVNDAEAVDALIESGLESEEGTKSYQLATEFKEKIKSGEKLTEAELSQLIKANDETFRSEEVVQREESQNVISEFAESMTEAEGKLFKEVYALNPDADAEAYHNAYNLVQEYAKKPTAYPIDYVLENKGVLTATQASKIYNSVVMSESATRKESERLLQEARKNVGIGNINDSIMNYGNESVEGKVNWNELTQRQKFGFVYAKGLAQAIGANVTFVGKDKRFNGAYSKSKDRIYIDIYAGMDLETLTGTDFIVPVLGHELTHKMEIDSAKLYKAFSNHVLDALEKGGKLTKAEMIEAEIDRLKNLGRDHTEADAIGEIVARASEGLILQSKEGKRLFNSLSESEQKTVVSTIKDLINKLINWIDGLLNSYSLRSVESKTLKSMKAEYEQALKMWDKMLADMAAKNKARKESGGFDSKAVNKALTDVGLTFDAESESVAPSAQLSERTWTQSEYVQNRETAIKAIVKAIGVSEKDAARYVDNINGIARMIADDRARLDYDPNVDENASVLKHNKEYKWTIDMSTLCAKRLLFTGTFDAIQKKMPNKAFNSEEIVALRSMMMERGYEVACGICYVESTRRELGPITEEFIERYKASQESGKPITKFNSKGKELILQEAGTQRQFIADKNYTPTLAELNTTDIDRVKTEHPDVYAAYLAFMKSRGQATPKLLETRTEYKGEILKHFNSKSAVKSRNDAGGLRVQSFSDFEVAHLIDMMQIVLDMSRVGLMSQAYTKVPAFADVFGNTGMKINLSLIAKDSGLDAKGNLIFDDVEGMPAKEAFRLRDKYSKNVGTILVGKNDAHIRAALNDPRIDYIIPYHKSFWKESLYDALGLNGYEDYTDTQNEKPFDKNRTIKNFQPSEYWDYSKSGKENADAYLKLCAEDGRVPKFPQFMKEEGYWKLLIDFKMYDNDGVGSPQMVVKPEFSMDEANAVMNAYEGGHREFPVAQDVVDDFLKQYEGKDDVQFSDRVTEITDDDYKNMKNHFGVTGNFNVAGYMLKDGKMLDFSGKHWGDDTSKSRQVDHRDIQEALADDNNGRDSMVNMISNGNIRLMPEVGGINLAVAPSKNQRVVLRGYIEYMSKKEGIIVDIDKVGGDTIKSFEYKKGTSSNAIMRDIDNYFKGGEQSELMRFHTAEGDGLLYSDRVTDTETLNFLNNQKTLKVYRAMQLIDGKLYPPMAAKVKNADGKKELVYSSEIGVWEQATERPELIKNGKFELDKANGSRIAAAYNPYIHTSASPLNDQFSSAYKRENLVTVEGEIPISELSSGYRAEFAKDSVGETKWHSGPVASKLKGDKARRVFLSRWFKPTRIVPDSEVASVVAKILEGENISVPYEVVTPSLRAELEKEGVSIRYSDRDDVDVYAIMGENARIRKENEKLKADVERLKELNKLEKKVTGGKVLKDSSLLNVAAHLKKISESRMDKVAVAKGLKNVYSYIMEAEQLDFEDVYRRCYAVADEMLKDVKPKTSEANDYAKRILKEIKGTRISLNENQKGEAKHRLGNDWLKQFFGKVIIAKDGISLDSKWQEWAEQYGAFFDADISDADQVVQLYETINSLKEASVFVEEYDTEEEKRWLATEIYNQYWNVSTVKTTADKYDKQIKLLKAEHKNTMTELRADYDARLKEQRASDKERYTKLVNDIKKRADREVELAKKHGQEMLDRYKESADRKTTLKSIMFTVNSLNKKLKTNSKDVHIPESLKPVVINLLNAIDTSSKQLLTEGIFTNADLARDKAFSKVHSLGTEKSSIYTLKKAIGSALGLFENAEKLASMSSDGLVDSSLVGLDIDMIEDIKAMINHLDALAEDGVKEFVLQNMNTKHLEILNNMVKRINHWAIIADKSLKNKHRERISTRSLKNIREMDSAGPRQEHIQAVEAMKNFFNWSNLLPVNAFKRLGPAATEFFEDLLESQGQCAFNTQEIMDFTDKLFKEYKLKNIKKWRTEEKTFELNLPGEEETTTVKMPVSYIMTLYCIAKQEDAKRHLYGVDENGIELTYTDEKGTTHKGGGMTIKGYKESKFSTKVNKSLDNTVINEAIVKKITSVLTDEQKAVADALQKYMGEKGSEWGNAVSMALYGIEKFGVKDYFPITASPHTLNTDKVRDEKVSLFSILNYGFTKERNPDARNSIEIADIFEVFANHMHMVAIYNAYGLSIYDVARWINFKGKSEKGKDISVTKSIENAFGKGALTYVDNLIKDLNGQHLSNRLGFVSTLFRNTKVAMVGNSLSVTLLQPTAYIKAMIKISPLRMAKAAALPHLIKRGIERAQKYSGLALLKSQGYFETGISSSTATKIMHDESFLQKRIEGSLIGAEWADKITWGVLWNACEFEVRAKQKDLKVGSEEYFKAVSKKLDEVICETQVVDSPLTKSDLMRSPDTKAKEVTQFASELTVAYNIVHECIYQTVLDTKKVGKKQALKKNYKNLTKSLTSYVLISYVTAVVSTMISDFRFDDDDEEEEFTERVKDAFLQELVLIGKIPYLRDVVSLFQGYDTTRTETLPFVSLYKAIEYSKKADEQIEKMNTAYTEDYKANAEKWAGIYDQLSKDEILKSISYASGYAFYNQWRDLRALLRLIGFMD